MLTPLTCPRCDRPLTCCTFYRCEPTQSYAGGTVEKLEEEKNLEAGVAVSCDQCAQFLPSEMYDPLHKYMEAVEAEAATEVDLPGCEECGQPLNTVQHHHRGWQRFALGPTGFVPSEAVTLIGAWRCVNCYRPLTIDQVAWLQERLAPLPAAPPAGDGEMYTEEVCYTLDQLDRVGAIRAIQQALLQLKALTHNVDYEHYDNQPAMAALEACLRQAGHLAYQREKEKT